MTGAASFDQTFRRATGCEPYDYQHELGTRTCPPAVIEVPTGSGKTMAVLVPWLCDPGAPRRLVYALPMRSLVEQTAQLAVEVFRHLEDGADPDARVSSAASVSRTPAGAPPFTRMGYPLRCPETSRPWAARHGLQPQRVAGHPLPLVGEARCCFAGYDRRRALGPHRGLKGPEIARGSGVDSPLTRKRKRRRVCDWPKPSCPVATEERRQRRN